MVSTPLKNIMPPIQTVEDHPHHSIVLIPHLLVHSPCWFSMAAPIFHPPSGACDTASPHIWGPTLGHVEVKGRRAGQSKPGNPQKKSEKIKVIPNFREIMGILFVYTNGIQELIKYGNNPGLIDPDSYLGKLPPKDSKIVINCDSNWCPSLSINWVVWILG